jgi:hypothetical protein
VFTRSSSSSHDWFHRVQKFPRTGKTAWSPTRGERSFPDLPLRLEPVMKGLAFSARRFSYSRRVDSINGAARDSVSVISVLQLEQMIVSSTMRSPLIKLGYPDLARFHVGASLPSFPIGKHPNMGGSRLGNGTIHPRHSRSILLGLTQRERFLAQLFPRCVLTNLVDPCSPVLRNIKNFYLYTPQVHSLRLAA